MRRIVITAASAALALGLASACSSGGASPVEPAPEVQEQQPDVAAPAATDSAEAGSLAAPLPVGSSAKMGAWDVSLGTTDQDATDLVMAQSEYNDPPEGGQVFVVAPVTVTLEGAASGRAGADLAFRFVGSDAITYGPCGVNDVPDALTAVGEMYSGAAATGNVCASVPASVVAGGVWVVMESMSYDDAKAFFAIE